MIHTTLTLTNHLGLHARAAAKLSQVSTQFQATVMVKKGNQQASADSILDLMMLMANVNETITITATGPEKTQALEAVVTLINTKFGEES